MELCCDSNSPKYDKSTCRGSDSLDINSDDGDEDYCSSKIVSFLLELERILEENPHSTVA